MFGIKIISPFTLFVSLHDDHVLSIFPLENKLKELYHLKSGFEAKMSPLQVATCVDTPNAHTINTPYVGYEPIKQSKMGEKVHQDVYVVFVK